MAAAQRTTNASAAHGSWVVHHDDMAIRDGMVEGGWVGGDEGEGWAEVVEKN